MSKKQASLGRSLIRDHKKKGVIRKDGFKHTVDLPDGFDWARLNLRSVTEQSSVDDFLGQVQVAENEFNKEFSNIKIITPDEAAGLLSEEEQKLISEVQEENKHVLSIPRRPPWTTMDTKEELDAKEREEFLKWRKKLSLLKERQHISLTPYELNIEVWRQLWRVIEKSDVVVQIIDARNPLLFRCEDLEMYVKEVDHRKHNVLLLNKADFLSLKQREMWASYFESIGVKIVFFSALQQSEPNENESKSLKESEATSGEETENSEKNDKDGESDVIEKKIEDKPDATDRLQNENKSGECDTRAEIDCFVIRNSAKMLSKHELVDFLKQYESTNDHNNGVTMVGMVGYPNVGKSSTINAVLSSKKVQVSATPGKTKHFQTLMVDSELCFCDCPGLVFPNFVSTKADMVINGILPVDQLTDHVAPVTLITNLIPRAVLESTYSIIIPPPPEGRDPDSPPTAEEFLNAYGYMRGFMTQRGLPDNARSARYILKDFVKGKLLYCYAPPDCDNNEFQKHCIRPAPNVISHQASRVSANLKSSVSSSDIDRNFFSSVYNRPHLKGCVQVSGYRGIESGTPADGSSGGKPWKKHNNRNKKEKLRRVYT